MATGASRRAIWIAFFANILLTLVGVFVVWSPAAPEWTNQKAFESVFYVVPRFVIASLVAFWVGEFVSSCTLAKMKLSDCNTVDLLNCEQAQACRKRQSTAAL
jgi:uncharacterized PurR-regulated membrane protein YhhQ (DUF165 family)